MDNNRYIVVMGWMMSVLGLSGNDLLAYALIYGYSQDGQGMYFGSIRHTADALNISPRATADVLKRLEDRGMITKVDTVINGVQRCARCVVVPDEVKRTPTPPGRRQEQEGKKQQPSKPTPARFEKPTLEEVREYCRQRNNGIDAEKFYAYYEANGWVQGRGKPIKSWRAAVITWEKSNFNYGYGPTLDRGSHKEATIAKRRAELADEAARLDAEYRARNACTNDAERVLDAT